MWFITSWIMRRRYDGLPFKMRNFTETYQSECRESIKKKFKKITKELEETWVRIRLKDAKNNMHQYSTDLLGQRKPVPKPIFTEDQVSRISLHKWLYVLLLIGFVLLETFFYSFFGSLLLQKQIRSVFAVYILGMTLALAFAFALHFSFRWIFEYLQAKYIVEKEKLDKIELKPFRSNLILGIIFCILFVIVNLAVGFLRADLLDPVAVSENKELVDKIHYSWRIFAVLFTFIIALLMAAIEKQIASKSEKWAVYTNWKRQQKERKVYNTKIKNMLQSCEQEKALLIEQYWSVTKDLQRVFRIEVDDDSGELLNELNQKITQEKNFLKNLDDETYQKYLPVAATRRELFTYGIENDEDIQSTLTDLKEKVKEIEEFESRNVEVVDPIDKELIPEVPEVDNRSFIETERTSES